MGKRSRRGTAAGENTDKLNERADRALGEIEAEIPNGQLVTFGAGFIAKRSDHPGVADALLDLVFVTPGLNICIRIPVAAWDSIEDAAHQAIAAAGATGENAETEQRATAAGLHLPTSVDLSEEAEAHRKIREGGE